MSETKSKILVPIHLDALVIKNDKALWKDLSLDIDSLVDNMGLGYYVEKGIEQNGRTNSNNQFYQDGIHLHWVLPSALRHGIHNRQTDNIEFPLVPNRWLVIRTSDTNDKIQLKSWIVESDFIHETATENFNWIGQNVVGSKLLSIYPQKIGRTIEAAESWSEKNTKELFLTVVAPGNPDFGASYMHSKNVFGFYDDMIGVAEDTKISYKVYGWFSDASANPFSGLNKELLEETLAALSWKVQGTETFTDENTPQDLICHAMISKVSWTAKKTDNIPSINDLKIGMGNTSAEALATMIRNYVSGSQLAMPDKLLAAYQYKSLRENGVQANSFNLLKKQTHSKTFNPVFGGNYWVVEKKEKDLSAGSKENQEIQVPIPFAPAVSSMLYNLNVAQQRYDNLQNELQSAQSNLYALNYKNNLLFTADNGLDDQDAPGIIAKIKTDIVDYRKKISTLKQQVSGLKQKKSGWSETDEWPTGWSGEIVERFNSLLDELKAPANNMQDFVIKEVPKPRYFEPSDPAIVIDGLNPSQRYIDKGSIICRTFDQLKSTVSIQNSFGEFNYKADELLDIDQLNSICKNLPDGISDLAKEAFLQDSLSAKTIANLVNNSQGGNLSNDQLAKLRGDIEASIISSATAASPNGDGAILPEMFSIAQWAQPWIPVYLEWGINWMANDKDVNIDWQFGKADNDIDYKTTQTQVSGAKTTYFGRTILSADMVNKVSELSKKLTGNNTDDFFQNIRPMSQTLSGLHNQLLTHYQGIQLPILQKDEATDSLIPDPDCLLIDDQYVWSPMVHNDAFYLGRGGFFQLSMLRVIDAFGQVLEIIPAYDAAKNDVSPSIGKGTLHVSAGMTMLENYFVMPPRILQPSRLNFSWIGANDPSRPTDSDPATSPVCGWLLHNILDSSISVFDSSGGELGELLIIDGAVIFQPVPGSLVISISNPALAGVINFAKTDVATFKALLMQIVAVSKKSSAKPSRQHFNMSLPVGLPLAIVTAECNIEVKGELAKNQYWNANDKITNILTQTYEVTTGNMNSSLDGVVAYFIDNNFATVNLPFLANNQVANFSSSNLHLQLGVTRSLTLLMDPRMAVSLSSAILPAEVFELPPEMIEQPLKEINLRFLVAPVITPASELKIPLMQSRDLNWNWLSWEKKGGVKIIKEKIPDSNVKASLKFEPLQAVEGWLKLAPNKKNND